MAGEGIGATGLVGLAFEATEGTYTAPTKWVPIMSENLKFGQEFSDRRVLRGIVDNAGLVRGNGYVQGDITMEVLHDTLVNFLYAGRFTVTKTGTGPWTYACLGNHSSVVTPTRSLTIAIRRNADWFFYVGCLVHQWKFNIQDGKLMVTMSIIGQNEATQTAPGGPFTFSTVQPFGMGTYTVQYDAATVTDTDNFELTVNDNGKPQFNLDTDTGAEYCYFGERTVELSVGRDFKSRTDYDAFRAGTTQDVDVTVSNGTDSVKFELKGLTKREYEIPLSGQGDIIRAAIKYSATYNATLLSTIRITVISSTANIT